jgi:hypothetical protein
MKLVFTEQAIESIAPPCFGGDLRTAVERGVAPAILSRASAKGDTYAVIAGRRVGLFIRVQDGVATVLKPAMPRLQFTEGEFLDKYGYPEGYARCEACRVKPLSTCDQCHNTGVVFLEGGSSK